MENTYIPCVGIERRVGEWWLWGGGGRKSDTVTLSPWNNELIMEEIITLMKTQEHQPSP